MTRGTVSIAHVGSNGKQCQIKNKIIIMFTTLEYDVLMQAINNAKAALADGEFIDPYGDGADEYTEDEIEVALNSAEEKIIKLVI